MLALQVTIENLDYDAAIDVLFPHISDALRDKLDDSNPFTKLLGMAIGKTEEFNKELVKGIVARLSQEKKEELLLWCVNGKHDEIEKLLEDAAGKQGVRIRLDDLHLRQIRE